MLPCASRAARPLLGPPHAVGRLEQVQQVLWLRAVQGLCSKGVWVLGYAVAWVLRQQAVCMLLLLKLAQVTLYCK